MVLIYWATFFPQALRWYLEQFGKTQYGSKKAGRETLVALQRDPVRRNLTIQAAICILLGAIGAAPLSEAYLIVGFAMFFGSSFAVTSSLENGVVFGVAFVSIFGLTYSVPLQNAYAISFLTGFLGALFCVRIVNAGIAVALIHLLIFGLSIAVTGLTLFLFFTSLLWNAFSQLAGAGVSAISLGLDVLCIVVAAVALSGRLLDWLFTLPFSYWKQKTAQVVWIPLPLQKRFQSWLEKDWAAGTRNLNMLVTFSLQFMPVVAAANAALKNSPKDQLMTRVAILADRPFDWSLLRFCSANLHNQLLHSALDGAFFVPSHLKMKWKSLRPNDLRLDAPWRSACAGFWLLHKKNSDRAASAFYAVRDYQGGREMYGIAQAIASGGKTKDLEDMAGWQEQLSWLDDIGEQELRPGALRALRILRRIAAEAAVAKRSQALLNCSAALGRGISETSRLIDTVDEFAPDPEKSLLKEIAVEWQGILVQENTRLEQGKFVEALMNPFEGYSGLPVSGRTFIGRHDILQRIETRWVTGDLLPALILYGHRRMGKTSILRNLELSASPGTIYLYIDMQDSGMVDHTGQLLLDFAEILHNKISRAGLAAGPQPAERNYDTLGHARQALNALLGRIDTQMSDGRRLVLAIDEFELIEKGIADGRIDSGFLSYLRSLNQRFRWLALIFGGLHTLDELGRDYQSAFYGQSEHIRVGYLNYDDTIQLITQPHPDFALEHTLELCEQIYKLTFGQPYLLQRLCWELVNCWNQRFLSEGEDTKRLLTTKDLDPIWNKDFFASAAYYFDGVWSNVTQNERILMAAMSMRTTAWVHDDMKVFANGDSQALKETLSLLKRHDVIIEQQDGVRFASELMRRWVADHVSSADVN